MAVCGERLKRRALSARSTGMPMAVSTLETLRFFDEQAEPVEA